MSEFDEMRQRESEKDSLPADVQRQLDRRIEQTLHAKASQVHFTAEQRLRMLTKLPARSASRHVRQRILLPAFAVIAAVVVIAAFVVIHVAFIQPPPRATILPVRFVQDNVYATPPQLAMDGRSISLDPGGQHIVYSVADSAGIMYSTDLGDPVGHNQLAMRYARDVSWSPDGSALVTTIYPADAPLPLLALVPTGQYMHLLGEPTLAASWLPSAADTITYISETNGRATLWGITPQGKDAHIIATMAMPVIVQSISWSPDGRYLAIFGVPGNTPTRSLLQGPSSALYLFDTRNHSLIALVAPSKDTIGRLAWSPDARMLTYEQVDGQGHTILHTLDVHTGKMLFSLSLQRSLAGMSWSPDSRILVYSDGGMLLAYTLRGTPITFSGLKGLATYPFWLDSQHILYFSVVNDGGQLARLIAQQEH